MNRKAIYDCEDINDYAFYHLSDQEQIEYWFHEEKLKAIKNTLTKEKSEKKFQIKLKTLTQKTQQKEHIIISHMVFARLIALDDCEKARKCLSERVMIPSIINMIVEGRCQELDEENEKTQRETDEETDDSNKALLLRRMADILEQKVKLNALKQ